MYIMKLNPKLRLLLIMLTIAISVFSMGMQEKNSLETQLLETWTIHNKMNLFLLAKTPSEYLKDSSSSGGRNVGEQFAHIHENRIAWIKEIAPEEAKELTPLTQNAKNITKEQLHSELIKSGVAIDKILSQAFAKQKLRNFYSHPAAFFGYLISHESHHRGQIVLSLKQAGHPLSEKVSYGLWDWN